MNDDDFLSAAEQAIEFLQHTSNKEYWIGKLPSPADERISNICTLYMKSTPIQRQVMYSCLNQEASFNLGTFAVRMAMLGVRQRSKTKLLHGLIALIMVLDWPRLPDVREILITLSTVYCSATKLGCTDSLFELAVQYAGTSFSRDTILDYLDREPESKRIEVMGWREIDGDNGLIYQFSNQPIPESFL